jgi:hypothetical protein
MSRNGMTHEEHRELHVLSDAEASPIRGRFYSFNDEPAQELDVVFHGSPDHSGVDPNLTARCLLSHPWRGASVSVLAELLSGALSF